MVQSSGNVYTIAIYQCAWSCNVTERVVEDMEGVRLALSEDALIALIGSATQLHMMAYSGEVP